MSESAADFDVVVVGGGPAGATAAAVLARAGLQVLLADADVSRGTRVGEGLPPGAKPLLRHLGLVDRLKADGHLTSCGNESAWGTPDLHSTHFVADPNGHGWHLDRERFDAGLRTVAHAAGADVWTAAKVRHGARAERGWMLTLQTRDGASQVRAPWLIDCTGRRAWTSRLTGATRVRIDRLVAFVARYASRACPHAAADSMTLVESAPGGWWYTSPLPGGGRVVVYLTDAHDASARKARSHQGFRALLADTRYIRARLAGHDDPVAGIPGIVAADSSRLDRVSGDGWLAAGDAAVSFDPLSSRGILNAMYSGMVAARAIQSRLQGDVHAIAEYDARIHAIYASYLAHRRDYYAQERRWADQEFWRTRRTPS